ncbi:MAG: hypothetical protein K2I96_03915 [Lachnospiraceae bacterium]|nr:hypothetical protein [Lachnospiraceae bacterium]
MSADMDKIFGQYKDRKIALYGLGTETERALHGLGECYEIVGLMDSFRTDGEIFGKPVISFDHAVDAGVTLIIVVARPGSCRAIAKAIGERCRREGIILMDVRGKNLLETRKVSYQFSNIDGMTKAELEKKIRYADVISFDLFDTLVMRMTLYSDDVAELVDCRLREKGIFIKNFCKIRLESEKELSINTAPTLTEIYQNMLDRLDNSSNGKALTAGQLAELEWGIDFELLVPRKEVCDIFRETYASGKKVYIVSDTYYSRNQLVQILEKCGIGEYTDILSSSDYQLGKTQGLYQCLKRQTNSKRYLHIGDDIVADIEKACDCGFDTYRVFSALDLLEDVGNLGLVECAKGLSDRLRIGMFVSVIFNSPFHFENADTNIYIHNAYEIGYLICAPMISDFVLWFRRHMIERKFQNIWFSARDGYLIKKLYEYLAQISDDKCETLYFLTSRTAAIRAGVRDENDIQYVDEMKFSGRLEENLRERFGISISDCEHPNVLLNENSLMKYRDVILEKAIQAYGNYQRYISRLRIGDGDIAFFDFVAKGTVQMYVQRLTCNRLKGFYFLQLEKEHMKEKALDIQSFYGEEETDCCAIFDNYYILETVLTAPHPSVKEFDETGKPVFADETRSKRDLLCFEKAQEGIFDYFKTYIRLCPEVERAENKKLDEVFLELIHKIKIMDSDFLDLVVEDSFFNRMTRIADVI